MRVRAERACMRVLPMCALHAVTREDDHQPHLWLISALRLILSFSLEK